MTDAERMTMLTKQRSLIIEKHKLEEKMLKHDSSTDCKRGEEHGCVCDEIQIKQIELEGQLNNLNKQIVKV